ncbi:hypothetical protein G6O69_01505 [Pseudenhygromyxa sp. WMMC2535]|uniref:hypothetical protein n=1 Tax=Pseudenhygromyxa sp. WMMC2535 TaxID=2712867 RepID=UPI0015569776|nr:hypothetical protein [Pseudenhygromyxa sp. WMMC2535]NVB36489.1 hypothetical protein [Pseudenhygromyxa sp. WMMC2535]
MDALAAVESATLELNTDPERGGPHLRAAIDELAGYAPRLASDLRAQAMRMTAELSLARAELGRGEEQAARDTLDAALRGWGDQPLPIERLGPSLGALVDERRDALDAAGRGRLRIECSQPCEAFVDERAVEAGAAIELYLGEHRVYLRTAADEPDAAELLRAVVLLDEVDAEQVLRFPERPSEAPSPPPPRLRPRPPSDEGLGARDHDPALGIIDHPHPRRLAPRGAEIAVMAVGGVAMVAGVVLWAIDSTCPGGADPNDVIACPELYNTRAAGVVMTATGAATLLTGTVLLSVDEVRAGERRDRSLSLHWRTRF